MLPVVQLKWEDSSSRNGWAMNDELEEFVGSTKCASVGILVDETDETLFLATTVGGGACLSPVAIPKRAVTSQTVLFYTVEDDEE